MYVAQDYRKTKIGIFEIHVNWTKNTIKQVDNTSLTKAESSRLTEIDTELGALITKDKAAKIDVGAKKIAEQIGVGFESFDTQDDVDSAIATLQEEGGEIDTKNSDNYGTFITLPGDRSIIILNKAAILWYIFKCFIFLNFALSNKLPA